MREKSVGRDRVFRGSSSPTPTPVFSPDSPRDPGPPPTGPGSTAGESQGLLSRGFSPSVSEMPGGRRTPEALRLWRRAGVLMAEGEGGPPGQEGAARCSEECTRPRPSPLLTPGGSEGEAFCQEW